MCEAIGQTEMLVQSPPVEEAARRWRAARLAVVNLSIEDPEYRWCVNHPDKEPADA